MGVMWQLLFRVTLLLTISASAISATTEITLNDNHSRMRINDKLLALEEQHSPLDIDYVSVHPERFHYLPSHDVNYGPSRNGIWLHTSLYNLSQNTQWVVDIGYAQNDRVDFYILEQGNVIATAQQGRTRNQLWRFPTLEFTLPHLAKAELYIRVHSNNGNRIAPVDIQTKAAHGQTAQWSNLLWGLFYGGLLMLALYYLVLSFGMAENSMWAYACYLVFVMSFQFIWGGHGLMLLDGDIKSFLNAHTDLLISLVALSAGVFSLTFLNAKEYAPKGYLVVTSLLGLLLLLSLTTLLNFLPGHLMRTAIYTCAVLALCSFVAIGLESYLNGFTPARYFIYGWGLLSIFSIVSYLAVVQIIPSLSFGSFSFPLGVFFESLLFALALMEKIKYKLEKEVRETSDELRNNMMYIEEQNVRLDLARKQAIRASKVKSQFLANMSHEIRTPLNAIIGFSKELLSRQQDRHRHAQIIHSSAHNLLNIINDVLDFSKIEAGKLNLKNEPFALHSMVEEVSCMMAKQAHEKNIEFVLDMSPVPESLIGDGLRLRQIMINLLSNAIKFTHQGQVRLRVWTETRPHGRVELFMEVEDTGIGISRTDQSKLFKAFSQIDENANRQYPGTGLGLVICQELVSLMNGRITLDSTPGVGSCFAASMHLHRLSHKMTPRVQTEWQHKHVVIVDANPESRRATAKLFTHLGAYTSSYEQVQLLDSLSMLPDFLVLSVNQRLLPQLVANTRVLESMGPIKPILLFRDPHELQQVQGFFEQTHLQLAKPLLPSHLLALEESHQADDQAHYRLQLQQLPPLKVLAVDDMEINLRLLSTWLEESPLELTLCTSGMEAIGACQRSAFDLILMDVQMPHMDGVETTQSIRKTPLNLGTPIVAVTAHAFKDEQDRLLNSGMDDFLSKPIELKSLLDLIKEWCVQESEPAHNSVSFDWSHALERAQNNAAAAREVMAGFMAQLPSMVEDIESSWLAADTERLKQEVHKLHGACCYTGVPRLRSLCRELEGALKSGHTELATKVAELLQESKLLSELWQDFPTFQRD